MHARTDQVQPDGAMILYYPIGKMPHAVARCHLTPCSFLLWVLVYHVSPLMGSTSARDDGQSHPISHAAPDGKSRSNEVRRGLRRCIYRVLGFPLLRRGMLDMCCSLSINSIPYKRHFGISVGAKEAVFFSDYSTPLCCSPPPVHALLPLVETMLSIDLDNIIHYCPPPIPKPPCKPPYLTISHDSSHPPSNKPILIHPLPPRPPCLSHERPETCHPRRQSPSPATSSLPLDRNVHLNEFDKELDKLEMAEFGCQETPGLCFRGGEETQAENINDTQRKELYDQCSGK